MDTENRLQKMEDILSSLGIEMSIEGCGCFNSPHVKFSYLGKKIVAQGSCNFNNFGKVKNDKRKIEISLDEYQELSDIKSKYEEMLKYFNSNNNES